MAPPVQLLRSLVNERSGFWITCDGGSMEPTISKGDKVWVSKGTPKNGDVAVFESKSGDLILHRVSLWPILGPWFWHVGDAPNPRGPRRARKRLVLGVAKSPNKKESVLRILSELPGYKWHELKARLGIHQI